MNDEKGTPMMLPREVVLDLLPAYLSGEASPATRELVVRHLERDPELARLAGELKASLFARQTPPLPPPDSELGSLVRTRSLLARMRWLFGLGMGLTALSLGLAITFQGGRLTSVRLLILDYPLPLGTLLVAGLGCFAGYIALRRRLRITAR